MQLLKTMWPQHRFLSLTAMALLLLAIVVADELTTSPHPTVSAGSQATGTLPYSEPLISGKSEASGESDISTPVDQVTTEVAHVSFSGADRSHMDDGTGELLLNSDASSLGAFSFDLLPGDPQSGPAADVSARSRESQESLDHEADSEESLTSQDKSSYLTVLNESACC